MKYANRTVNGEVIDKILKRTTEPTTVYEKQKADRDDAIDITDFEFLVRLLQRK